MNLQEIFDKDKRGCMWKAEFVKQIDESYAVHKYYGMGEVHQGLFSYSEENGWKFEKYWDEKYESLPENKKTAMWLNLFESLEKAGFSKITEKDNLIIFDREK